MRLVDADKQLEWVDCMKPIHGIGLEPVVAVKTVRDLVNGALTIDAIPVEWLEEHMNPGMAHYAPAAYRLLMEEWKKEKEARA